MRPIATTSKTPDELIAEIRERERKANEAVRNAVARKAEQDKMLLRETLSEDALFSITYVPFVIAEVAWDYVDTIFDLAQIGRLHETKKLARAIKELHREYDRKRFRIIDSDMRQSETDNMIHFQDELSEYFGRVHRTFNEALLKTYEDIDSNSMYLVSSAYVCRIVLKALFKYSAAQEKIVSSLLGYAIASIVPVEMRKLHDLVIEYVGDMPLPPDTLKGESKFVDELATYISDIELNEQKDS